MYESFFDSARFLLIYGEGKKSESVILPLLLLFSSHGVVWKPVSLTSSVFQKSSLGVEPFFVLHEYAGNRANASRFRYLYAMFMQCRRLAGAMPVPFPRSLARWSTNSSRLVYHGGSAGGGRRVDFFPEIRFRRVLGGFSGAADSLFHL